MRRHNQVGSVTLGVMNTVTTGKIPIRTLVIDALDDPVDRGAELWSSLMSNWVGTPAKCKSTSLTRCNSVPTSRFPRANNPEVRSNEVESVKRMGHYYRYSTARIFLTP